MLGGMLERGGDLGRIVAGEHLAIEIERGIAPQRVPCISQPAYHVLPSREKLAKVTPGRRVAVISAVMPLA